MNKGDLINSITERVDLAISEVKKGVDATFMLIGEALARGEKVQLKGFGTFELKTRAARKGRNPQTGEEVAIPATKIPIFKPSKNIKKKLVVSTRKKLGLPKVIAVTSGKGGTGKSNFVINTAIALAQKGLKVYVLDADLGTANVDVLLGISAKYTLNHLINQTKKDIMDIVIEGPQGIKIVPGGSGLQSLTELPEKDLNNLISKLNVLEEHADVILIDTGAGISRNVVNFVMAADEVVVVITPEPHSITDAYAMIKVLSEKKLQSPVKLVFNLVESQAEAKEVAAKILEVIARFLEIKPEPLGYILKDENVVKSIKNCRPFILNAPTTPASKCIIAIAQKLNPLKEEDEKPVPVEYVERKGFFSKLKSLFSSSN